MTTYSISSTDGSLSIPVQAGTINGPDVGAANIDTDLILYGQGSFNWGQGIEQNLLRIMESFASPAVNPSQPDSQQTPDPEPVGANPTLFGIKNPVVGQLWFNKSNNRLYVCTAPRIKNTTTGAITSEPVWELDAEGRFLSLTGGSLSGNIQIARAAGNGGTGITLHSQDNESDVFLLMRDSTGDKGKIFVEQNSTTNVDTVLIQKLVGANLVNEIALRDDYIETHPIRGKLRTPLTVLTDDDSTVTTKSYVDSQISNSDFNGGQVTNDIEVLTSHAAITVNSNDSTTTPKFLLADSTGNKGKISLDQISGGTGVDELVISKGVFNGTNAVGVTNNEIRMKDTITEFTRNIVLENSNAALKIVSTNPLNPASLQLSDNQSVKGELLITPVSANGNVDDYVMMKLGGGSVLNELRLGDNSTRTLQNFEVVNDDPAINIEHSSGAKLSFDILQLGQTSNPIGRILITNSATSTPQTAISFSNSLAIINNPTSLFATNFSDPNLRLTTKNYVDDRVLSIGGTLRQTTRRFEQSSTSGTWYDSDSEVVGSGTVIPFADLSVDLPILDSENYKFRNNSGAVFYDIDFHCAYILNYDGPILPTTSFFASAILQFNIVGDGLGFRTLLTVDIPIIANAQRIGGRITEKALVGFQPGDQVQLRLDPDSFGPIERSVNSLSNPPPQSVLDDYTWALVSDIRWDWRT